MYEKILKYLHNSVPGDIERTVLIHPFIILHMASGRGMNVPLHSVWNNYVIQALSPSITMETIQKL